MSRRGITITSTAGKVSRAFKIVVQFYAFERCISGELVPPSANTDSVFEAGIELKRGYSQTPVFSTVYQPFGVRNFSASLAIFGLCRATKNHWKTLGVGAEVTN